MTEYERLDNGDSGVQDNLKVDQEAEKQKKKDVGAYAATYLALLFVALREQFGIELEQPMIDLLILTFVPMIVAGWGIFKNKYLFPKGQEEFKVLKKAGKK